MFQLSQFKYIAAVALTAGVATQVMAAPTPNFKVNTAVFDGVANAKDFTANFINGTASTLLTLDAVNQTISGQGFTRFTSFSDINGTLDSLDTNLRQGQAANSGYLLWGEYSYTTKLVSGGFGSANSAYLVTSLNFAIFGEVANGAANNSTFNTATNAGTGGTVVHSADTKLLNQGSLLLGVSTINAQAGTSFNAFMTNTLTADGTSFFYDPAPFYNMVFTSFTNTTNGFAPGVQYVAINNASGGIDFNNRVPEPSALALVALGLLGAGLAGKRRRQA